MQEPPVKSCPNCGEQNFSDAQFCLSCGARLPVQTPAPPLPVQPRPKQNITATLLIVVGGAFFGCCGISGIIGLIRGDKTTPATGGAIAGSPAATPSTSSAASGGERMVLDNAHVTVHVECTHQEWKQYKISFIVKKPGSPLLAPILRQAGNPKNVYSVFVNGVDTGDDFAFGPNIAAFDSGGDLIPATFVSRPLNGNVALGYAYHDLVVKYERGN